MIDTTYFSLMALWGGSSRLQGETSVGEPSYFHLTSHTGGSPQGSSTRVQGDNRSATTWEQGDNRGAHLSRFGLFLPLGFYKLGDQKIWKFPRGLHNLSPPTSNLNSSFPENTMSMSVSAEKKEGRFDGALTLCQAPLPTFVLLVAGGIDGNYPISLTTK